jgi:DHA1 family inner membrane transport protein
VTATTHDAPNGGWRATIGSSSIMSLALLGDALLYAVLPVYGEPFGLTLPWVGVMLSANRFVRLFAYDLLARLTQTVGVRRMCMVAAVTATVSTAIYGFGHGPAVMLAARFLWGLTYAVLVLATLSYAIEHRRGIGTRVGVGQAIQRLGPILALLGGAWLVGALGPNMTFVLLAIPTALSLAIAFSLPKARGEAARRGRTPSLARPAPIDVVYFLQGYGVDGVFAVSITLIFAREGTLAEAVMGGSALLAVRHFGEAIAAPLFGWIGDRLGARRVFVAAAILMTAGFGMVAAGLTVAGALVMLIFRGALASLGPAVIAQGLAPEDDAIGPLARMQAWRDFGAAVGPLMTGFLLTAVTAELLHATVGASLAASLAYWLAASQR